MFTEQIKQWLEASEAERDYTAGALYLLKLSGHLANIFAYEAFGRELFMWDYNMGANGHVLRRIRPLTLSTPKGFCLILK